MTPLASGIAAGSIGVSFVMDANDPDQVLGPADIAGIGADEQGNWTNVQGDLTLSTTDGKQLQGYAFNFGWNGGKHEFSRTPAGGDDKCSTYVRFENVSARDIVVAMKWRGGKGWTGMAGLQIIPR